VEAVEPKRLRSRKTTLNVCLRLVVFEQQRNVVQLVPFTIEQYLKQNPSLFPDADAIIAQRLLRYLICNSAECQDGQMTPVRLISKEVSNHDLRTYLMLGALSECALSYGTQHEKKYQVQLRDQIPENPATRPAVVPCQQFLSDYLSSKGLRVAQKSNLLWVKLLHASLLQLDQLALSLIDQGVNLMYHEKLVNPPNLLQWLAISARRNQGAVRVDMESTIRSLLARVAITDATFPNDIKLLVISALPLSQWNEFGLGSWL
jgi:hypothetical protein